MLSIFNVFHLLLSLCDLICTHTWAVLTVDRWSMFRFSLDLGLLFACYFVIYSCVVWCCSVRFSFLLVNQRLARKNVSEMASCRLWGIMHSWFIFCWFRCYIHCLLGCLDFSLTSFFFASLVTFPLRILPLCFQTRGHKRWPNLGI